MLVEFGMQVSRVAQIGLFTQVVYMIVVGIVLTVVDIRIVRGGGHREKVRLNFGMSFLFMVIVLTAILAGLGVLPGAQHAWLATTIVFLMMHATAELGVFVVRTTRQSNS